MQLISSSNKPLFVHLPTLPFGQQAAGLKPHPGLGSSFRESLGPLPLLSTLDNSQKSEGLYFLKQVAPFRISGMALAQWPSK